MRLSHNSSKNHFKQSRKSTNVQQSNSEIYLPLVEVLLKLIYPHILPIQKIAFDRIKSKYKNKLVIKKNKKQQYMQAFMNHCAILIQSNLKGFIQRKKYKQFLPIYRRFKQIFVASIQGWKTRKILGLSSLKKQKTQIIKNIQLKKQKEVRIAKRQYLDDFNRLFKNGNWIQILRKQPKYGFKRIQFINNKVQGVRKHLLLYENIKAVSNLKEFLRASNQKTQKYSSSKNQQYKRQKCQKSLKSNSKMQNFKNGKNNQKRLNQQVRIQYKQEQDKNIQRQNDFRKEKIKSQRIKIQKKLTKTQLQIRIEPQIQNEIDSFKTPKYHQTLLKHKRTLNIGNSQESKTKQSTQKKYQKQNQSNINNLIDKSDLNKQAYSIKVNQTNQKNNLLINVLEKKRQKKGLGMTLSKHFQFEIEEFINLNNTKKINFERIQPLKQTSQFDQTNNFSNKINSNNNLNKQVKINSLEDMKTNFKKKIDGQLQRQKQIQSKIQMMKNSNNFL